jgi:hypothetical protein
VRVTSGTTALGPNDDPGAGVDIVALDDFLYAEPQAFVSEPPILELLGVAFFALTLTARRRNPS